MGENTVGKLMHLLLSMGHHYVSLLSSRCHFQSKLSLVESVVGLLHRIFACREQGLDFPLQCRCYSDLNLLEVRWSPLDSPEVEADVRQAKNCQNGELDVDSSKRQQLGKQGTQKGR